MTKKKNPLRVLSLGAGVQSSTLLLLADCGEIKVDCAIFSDTQHEPHAVYRWLRWLQKTVRNVPIYVVTRGDLWQAATNVRRTRDGERTYIRTAIPVFTVDGLKKGRGMRACTRDFKIAMVQSKTRELLGLRRISKDSGVLAEMLIGISTDEFHRVKASAKHWIKNCHPLIDDFNMSRDECTAWCLKHYGVVPPRSACTFCPFRSDEQWLSLTKAEFKEAVVMERELQRAYARTTELESMPYFHASRVPLDQVKFTRGHGRAELNKFVNECEGMCGV